MKVVLFVMTLIVFWQTASSLGLLGPDYIFPSPAQVWSRLVEMAGDGMLWPSVRATLARMAIGFGIAAVIGLFVGLLMGVSTSVNQCLRSLFLGLQTLPSAAWAPIALLIFGLHDTAIYFVIVMSSTAAVAIATADGIAHIPPVYLRAAKTLGVPRYALAHRVIFPAALPGVLTGLKLGWTMGWHGAVSAELIKSSLGLGFLLHMGRELSDAPQVIGVMLCTIALGLVLDQALFGVIERRVRRRWGMATPEL